MLSENVLTESQESDLILDWYQGRGRCPHKSSVSPLPKDCLLCLRELVGSVLALKTSTKGMKRPAQTVFSTEGSERERNHAEYPGYPSCT